MNNPEANSIFLIALRRGSKIPVNKLKIMIASRSNTMAPRGLFKKSLRSILSIIVAWTSIPGYSIALVKGVFLKSPSPTAVAPTNTILFSKVPLGSFLPNMSLME